MNNEEGEGLYNGAKKETSQKEKVSSEEEIEQLMNVDDWYVCVKDEGSDVGTTNTGNELPAYLNLWAGETTLFYSKSITEKSLIHHSGELIITNAFIRIFENV